MKSNLRIHISHHRLSMQSNAFSQTFPLRGYLEPSTAASNILPGLQAFQFFFPHHGKKNKIVKRNQKWHKKPGAKSESFGTKSFEINLMPAFHLHLRQKQTANRQLAVIEIQCKSMVICHTGVENAPQTQTSTQSRFGCVGGRAELSWAELRAESGALCGATGFPPKRKAMATLQRQRQRCTSSIFCKCIKYMYLIRVGQKRNQTISESETQFGEPATVTATTGCCSAQAAAFRVSDCSCIAKLVKRKRNRYEYQSNP